MQKVLEIPPDEKFFEVAEDHAQGDLSIRINFYKSAQDRYFVWPYIRRDRGNSETFKHFQVLSHFDTKDAAREAALAEGQTLIAAGFDMDAMD